MTIAIVQDLTKGCADRTGRTKFSLLPRMNLSRTQLTSVRFGRECRCGSSSLPRHRHATAYLSLILKGGHEEAGDRGRFRVSEGHVLAHGAFEAHQNCYSPRGAEVLNLALDPDFNAPCPFMSVPNPDEVVRLAERSPREAASLLLETAKPVPTQARDWPEELAAAIAQDPCMKLAAWAQRQGLADATVTRGFRQVFGVSPSGYRAQTRARVALQRIVLNESSLASTATQCGFADQAHMNHAVMALTGLSPGAWRRQVRFVQDFVRAKETN